MTKAEIIKALEGINDNEEIVFMYNGTDRDGWPEEKTTLVHKMVAKKVYEERERVKEVERRMAQIEELKKDIEDVREEIKADNPNTKAGAERIAENERYIKWIEEHIAMHRNWLEKNKG